MSVIFGIASLAHDSIENEELLALTERTKAYAQDDTFLKVEGAVGMGFQPYHTTGRSRFESQPLSDARGNIIVFDGRLDNHEQLKDALSIGKEYATDSALVLTAFECWGENSFSRLVGDWSLALWLAGQRRLYLVRDHAGTRTLYYRVNGDRLTWSTYLESFLGTGERLRLDEEFTVRFLGGLPIRTTTPYDGIRAVPPAHVLIFEERNLKAHAHWSPLTADRLIYKGQDEYDEHFMECFERSIRRRDSPGAPVLAELSGGMDSTAIVCTSDSLRRRVNRDDPLLDTVSYYDDSEPDWNELPYIAATESYRGKTGIHISTSYLDRSFVSEDQMSPPYAVPGFDANTIRREEEFNRRIASGNYRVILSGLGGDELLGGVPTPFPELSDHFVCLRFRTLARRTTDWCLANRDPFFSVLSETLRSTFDLYRRRFDARAIAPWVSPRIREHCIELASEEEKQWPLTGFLPSSISNARSWLSIIETLPHLFPKIAIRREYRYPYLDKDLATYLLRVPREQLVQPGRRRVLMRRTLKPLMPSVVLERRRKAFIMRGPYALIQRERTNIERLLSSSRLENFGLVDMPSLKRAINSVYDGVETAWSRSLLAVLVFELWLRANDGSLIVSEDLSDPKKTPFGAYKIPTAQIESRSTP